MKAIRLWTMGLLAVSVSCAGLLGGLPARADDDDKSLVEILKSAVKPYPTACPNVEDYVTDQDDRLWQHRWCPIRKTVDGKPYVARHDYFHADNGTAYVFQGVADWYNCSDKINNKPVIPPKTYAIQCQ